MTKIWIVFDDGDNDPYYTGSKKDALRVAKKAANFTKYPIIVKLVNGVTVDKANFIRALNQCGWSDGIISIYQINPD